MTQTATMTEKSGRRRMKVGWTDTKTDRGSSEEDVHKEGGTVPLNVNISAWQYERVKQSATTMNNGQSSKTFVACLWGGWREWKLDDGIQRSTAVMSGLHCEQLHSRNGITDHFPNTNDVLFSYSGKIQGVEMILYICVCASMNGEDASPHSHRGTTAKWKWRASV